MRQMNLWEQCSTAVETLRPAQGVSITTRNDESLVRFLSDYLGAPVRLQFTSNRSTMLTYREGESEMRLRVHEIFRSAPGPIWEAIAQYLADDDRAAGKLVDAFIEEAASELPQANVVLQPEGRYHDLSSILDQLNHTYFHGKSTARITWGSASGRRYRRSIQLGCYVSSDRLIRIHPSLDQAFVPHYYVAWVVFHEMLHEVFGVERDRRHSIHPPEFVAIEQSYPDYVLCKRWEEANLHRLLRFRPERKA